MSQSRGDPLRARASQRTAARREHVAYRRSAHARQTRDEEDRRVKAELLEFMGELDAPRYEVVHLRSQRGLRGHEQRGSRFAVIVQNDALLAMSTVIVAPTSTGGCPTSFASADRDRRSAHGCDGRPHRVCRPVEDRRLRRACSPGANRWTSTERWSWFSASRAERDGWARYGERSPSASGTSSCPTTSKTSKPTTSIPAVAAS